MKRLTTHLVSVAGATASIIAIVGLLASSGVRSWSTGHSTWIYACLVAAVLAVVLVVDYAVEFNRRYRILRAAAKKATDHDNRLLQEILSQIPIGGTVITWLKREFFVKAIPTARVQSVEQAYENLIVNPLGFDNPQVNEAYERLKEAIEAFSATVTLETRYDGNNYERLCVPLSTKERNEDGYYAALNNRNSAAEELARAYDQFLLTCRMHGIDVYNKELSAT